MQLLLKEVNCIAFVIQQETGQSYSAVLSSCRHASGVTIITTKSLCF